MDRCKPTLRTPIYKNFTALHLNYINLINKIQKDIILLKHNIAAQQLTLEFLNRHTTKNLQTIEDAVHQLVHIPQNTQDNTQTTTLKTTKFQETAQTNGLMTLEFIKRNDR